MHIYLKRCHWPVLLHQYNAMPLYVQFNFPLCNLCSGGWVILQVPPHPGLVGETLEVTCRLRVKAKLPEVILYKDGVEVMRQIGINPQIYLTNVTLEDQGMYSCRASWDADGRTHSAISVEASVQVAGKFVCWLKTS